MLWREPIRGPLPGVPGHVKEAVAVRGEGADRCRSLVAIELQVLPWELALPGVRHRLPFRELRVSPYEHRPVESTARGVLPLSFCRQLLADPCGIRLGVLKAHMDDRMPLAPLDHRAGSAGPFPGCAGNVRPPVAEVVQI